MKLAAKTTAHQVHAGPFSVHLVAPILAEPHAERIHQEVAPTLTKKGHADRPGDARGCAKVHVCWEGPTIGRCRSYFLSASTLLYIGTN